MIDLNDAEVRVETRLSLNSGEPCGNRFRLSDYATIGEFFIDCAAWFSDEVNPQYVYTEWENIPDGMITRHWISPNLFELREALQNVEDSQRDAFEDWCTMHGWNPATDEPHKIVADFLESVCGMTIEDEDKSTSDDPEYLFLNDTTGRSFERFTDDYS